MKKIMLGLLLAINSLQILASTTPNNIAREDKKYVLDEQGNPSPALLQLLSVSGIKHDGSLASMVKETQATWLRKDGIERWDIVDSNDLDRDLFFTLFNQLGIVEQIRPQNKNYEYALWFGSAYPNAENRLDDLVDLWNQGVRFKTLAVLTGARPLTQAEIDAVATKYQLTQDAYPKTEADMIQLVLGKTQISDDMKKVPVTFINVPMQKNAKGDLVRPTTADTVNFWLANKPTPGNCIAISNQPYVDYQKKCSANIITK